MAKSTAKAEAIVRDLRDRLDFRGIASEESKNSEGYPRLVIDTDQASLEIEQADAVSKDIFENDLRAFSPHFAVLAVADTYSREDYTKLYAELNKVGIDKVILKTGADLATAEAAAGEEIQWDIRWPTKGM